MNNFSKQLWFPKVAPFQANTDQDFTGNEYYTGTLFRFPLRDLESTVSDNLYDEDNINDLFEEFKAEADNILLFLNHVTCITLTNKSTRETFMVKADVVKGQEDKNRFLRTLKNQGTVVGKGLLDLKNDSHRATWTMKITKSGNHYFWLPFNLILY